MSSMYFLDFDGVLTNKFSRKSTKHPGLEFDQECVDNLKFIVDELRNYYEKVALAIISNWRYELTNMQIIDILNDFYNLGNKIREIVILEKVGDREHEIRDSLSVNLISNKSFIILDDKEYYDELLRQHQIQTRSEDGIRAYEDVIEVIFNIINK